ncbi:MAG: hypothetical protein F4X98_19615 [Gammaproteobacteria bacterium]|nr:hypothetical protein [Gammaproteobacteria bacterium]
MSEQDDASRLAAESRVRAGADLLALDARLEDEIEPASIFTAGGRETNVAVCRWRLLQHELGVQRLHDCLAGREPLVSSACRTHRSAKVPKSI